MALNDVAPHGAGSGGRVCESTKRPPRSIGADARSGIMLSCSARLFLATMDYVDLRNSSHFIFI
jgi:hypothetical protein